MLNQFYKHESLWGKGKETKQQKPVCSQSVRGSRAQSCEKPKGVLPGTLPASAQLHPLCLWLCLCLRTAPRRVCGRLLIHLPPGKTSQQGLARSSASGSLQLPVICKWTERVVRWLVTPTSKAAFYEGCRGEGSRGDHGAEQRGVPWAGDLGGERKPLHRLPSFPRQSSFCSGYF